MMLTAKQVGAMLGLSARAIYDLAQCGDLVFYRFGRAVRFDPEDVERYKEQSRVVVAASARPPRFRTVNLRVPDPSGKSDLEKAFRQLGIKPRVTRPRKG